MDLSTPVSHIPFIGQVYAKRLDKLGVRTAEDLLNHYPSRYEDFSLVSPINTLQGGETVTVKGNISSISSQRTRTHLTIQNAVVADGTGFLDVTWFNQPFLADTLKPGISVSLSGTVKLFRGRPTLESPEYELMKYSNTLTPNAYNLTTIHTARLVPVYPETYGVSSKWLRSRIVYLLKTFRLEEILPDRILKQYGLINLDEAVRSIHFPASYREASEARRRLAFDEVFITGLVSRIRRNEWRNEHTGYQIPENHTSAELFIRSLPFELTMSQKKALSEIRADLSNKRPMNRLLQGDVGSGKTVVAAAAMYCTAKQGYQSVLMAPTEILARQHFETIQTLFKPFDIPVAFVSGSVKKRTGTEPVIIGTHALLHNQKFNNLALVVIDEQQRFGVEQRTKLQSLGIHPHLLTTTATPIPRSAALVLYSELDLSYLDEMPTGRKPVRTWLVPNEKREKAYEWISKQLRTTHNLPAGRQGSQPTTHSQAFIICPLIEESGHETMVSVRAVKKEFEHLARIFHTFKLGLLHGKLSSKQKKEVLAQFEQGAIDILVATPVVEVGIDIPNATIMVIEASERFGLSQLHQLRGRVGRGDKQSYCLLFTESAGEKTRTRLKSLESMHSGAALSELDLKLRGPGQIYGTRQHGFSGFKIATFSDTVLISQAQEAAERIISDDILPDSPSLQKKLKSYTIASIANN